MKSEEREQQTESVYLKRLASFFQRFRYVLVYGAGGVTQALIPLLKMMTDQDKTCIVVSENVGSQNFWEGYPFKKIDEFQDICDKVYVIISVMPGSMLIIEETLRQMGFLYYCRVDQIIDELYSEIWADAQVEDNKILFSNFGGNGFGGNPKYIAIELMKNRKGLDCVWVVNNENYKMPEGVRCVKKGTYEYYQELATSHIWIDNQHKDFHTRKREGQIYIQTWHGCGPLKKIEFDAPELPASYLELCEMNSKMEDLAISPTGFNTKQFRRAFHYQGEIMECGYPRNDIFWAADGCTCKIKRLFGIREEENIVLYAPTFREREALDRDELDLAGVCDALEKKFRRKYWMFVRLHPSEKNLLKSGIFEGKGIINVTLYDDVQELLAAADVLITDYSSIMWDFSLQKKPIFLFHPDCQNYDTERGFYLPFERMPYIEAVDNTQLYEKIAAFDAEKYENALMKFLINYGTFDKGTASRAVAERLLTILDEKTPKIG